MHQVIWKFYLGTDLLEIGFNTMPTLSVTGSSRNSISIAPNPVGAVIIYGRGDDLGDFKVFADHLKKDLESAYSKRIKVINIQDKTTFFQFLVNFNEGYMIKEMHILSHAIGGGLFLDYGGNASSVSRMNAFGRAQRQGRNITYSEVVDAEIGAILSDDFVSTAFSGLYRRIRPKFVHNAFIKLWGCNAGKENWTYSDDDYTGDGIMDVYWSALNTQNIPKPSVAKSFAQYFKLKVFGARSGSHIVVFDSGSWITSQEYKNRYGRWANPSKIKHRLQPDTGPYYEYLP